MDNIIKQISDMGNGKEGLSLKSLMDRVESVQADDIFLPALFRVLELNSAVEQLPKDAMAEQSDPAETAYTLALNAFIAAVDAHTMRQVSRIVTPLLLEDRE